MVFEQKFGFSEWFFVHMWQFHSDFYCFFDFLDRIFFLNGFPNPFTTHSMPSFSFELNFYFSLMVFCSNAAF